MRRWELSGDLHIVIAVGGSEMDYKKSERIPVGESPRIWWTSADGSEDDIAEGSAPLSLSASPCAGPSAFPWMICKCMVLNSGVGCREASWGSGVIWNFKCPHYPSWPIPSSRSQSAAGCGRLLSCNADFEVIRNEVSDRDRYMSVSVRTG